MPRSCIKYEGRSFEVGLQEQASNHLRVALVKSQCEVRLRKRQEKIFCQIWSKETSTNEPLKRCRKLLNDVKTRNQSYSRINPEDTCLLTGWRPAYRWRELGPGFYVERGNLSPRCKGRNSSGSPTRARVPMRGIGAEQLVVAMKSL